MKLNEKMKELGFNDKFPFPVVTRAEREEIENLIELYEEGLISKDEVLLYLKA